MGWGTERKLHVEHEVEEHSECPHVDLKAVEAALVSRKDLGRHELLSSQDSATDVCLLLAETEICQFEALNPINVTSLPLSLFIRTFCDLMSRCRYPS